MGLIWCSRGTDDMITFANVALIMENYGDTTFVHNFVHNSPTWRVVVGGGVTQHHSSTNHNSPRRQVVHKVVHIVVALEPLTNYMATFVDVVATMH